MLKAFVSSVFMTPPSYFWNSLTTAVISKSPLLCGN
ncbi:MAG: hypothetical protein ACI8RD_001059, partial [Bacillariaceae sp.]